METPPRLATSPRASRLVLALLLVAFSATLAVLPALRAGRPSTAPGAAEFAVLGAALALVSLLGTVAALRPAGCNRLLGLSRSDPRLGSTAPIPPGCSARGFAGHHLDCGAFSSHTLRLGDRIVCAGCAGMVAGGITGILFGLALMSGVVPKEPAADAALGLFGAALAVAGILGAYRRDAPAWARVVASFVLVVGSVTLAVSLAGQGALPGAFGLAAAIAALGLRVDLSRLQHASACAECAQRLASTSAAGAAGARATAR